MRRIYSTPIKDDELTQIPAAEYTVFKALFLKVMDIKGFVTKVEERISSLVETEPEMFCIGGNVEITNDDISNIVEIIFAEQYGKEWDVPTVVYTSTSLNINRRQITLWESYIRSELNLWAEEKVEQEAFERNPLGYNGMKQSDFI